MNTTTATATCRGCGLDLPYSKFPTFRTGAGEYHRSLDLCRSCKKAGGQVPAKVAAIVRYAERCGCVVEHTVDHDDTLGRIDHVRIKENWPENTVNAVLAGSVSVQTFTRRGVTKVFANGYGVSGHRGSRKLDAAALRTAVWIMGISSPTRDPQV